MIKHLDSKCLFIRNSSKDVLTEFIIITLKQYPHREKICLEILNQLLRIASDSPSSISAVISLIETCRKSRKACQILLGDLNSKPVLVDIIKETDCSSVETHIGTLLAVLMSSDINDATVNEMFSNFIAWKKYQAAIIFSSEVLKKYPEMSQMMQAMISPVICISNPFQLNFQFDIISVDVKLGRKLVYTSLSCLISSCSYEPCPVTYTQFSAVLSILKMSFSENPPAILKADKLKFSCLDFFYKYHKKELPIETDAIDNLLSTWMQIITTCSSNCPLVVESIKWLGHILSVGDEDINNYETIGEIENLLNWHLMDTRWEVQDSVIELITSLITSKKHALHKWLVQQRYHIALCDLIMAFEPNAYVIASSLKAILSYLEVDTMKDVLLRDLSLTREKYFTHVTKILEESNDYIVRRAASLAMASYHLNDLDTSWKNDRILLNMTRICQHDLDWTVKLNAISFWENILNEVFASTESQESMLKTLESNGFISSIIPCFYDHEITVKETASNILRKIQSRLKIDLCEEQANNVPSEEQNDMKEHCEEQTSIPITAVDRENGIDDVLDIDESQRLVRLLRSDSLNQPLPNDFKNFAMKHHSFQDLTQLIRSTNFQKHCAEFEKRAETYHDNFSSLISDLFDCMVISSSDQKEVTIDCY